MRPLRSAPLAGFAIVLLSFPGGAQVSSGESGATAPHPEAQEAISKLKSPFCPGLMLEVCPSPQAEVLRDSIQTLARNGMEADSIVEWMLASHGEEWRAVPRAEGKGIWAWVIPPLALVLGLAALVLALGRFRSEPRHAEPRALSPEERTRLDEALRELEETESEDALL